MSDRRSACSRLWAVLALLGALLLIPSSAQAAAAITTTPRYVLPVTAPAVVLTPYQPPASRYGPGHRGVDLAATAGGPVLAAGAGVVAYAGPVAGTDVVSIDHPDGIRTTYEPVSAVVRVGQRIAAGQLIGRLQRGHPSCSPSTCLHWGARLADGSYLDPMGLLAGLKVRLLPWT